MAHDSIIRFAQAPGVVAHTLDGDVVIMNQATGKYFGLNTVSAEIWQLLAQPCALDAICTALFDEFEVDKDACRQEVADFLDSLLAAQLVQAITTTD